MTAARMPAGLGPGGKSLWRSIVAEFDLPVHERRLLLEACRTTDNLDHLAGIVANEGHVVDGKPHPALVESRQLRLVLARLVASLRVPDDPDEAAGRPQRRGAARGAYNSSSRTPSGS